MSQSKGAVAFCWVPNIGKTVTSVDELKSRVDGRTHRIARSDWEFAFRCNGHDVTASMDGMDVVTIHTLDDSGLCVIYDVTPVPKSEKMRYSMSAMHGAVWATFRELVDSSSDICRCTAMDQLIPLSDACDVSDKDDMCKEIVKRFIQALENITDANTYVDDGSPMEPIRELNLDSVVRANILYLERFVDIYASNIGEELDDYKSQIRSRKEKIAMMRSYHSEKHRIENARNIEDLIVASNELAEASKGLISNMATYSKNIDDQTTKIVGFTESNGEMSRRMAWMAGISLVIALASFVYSVLF